MGRPAYDVSAIGLDMPDDGHWLTGELSVNHLADIVDESPTSVSQHLARLRMSRMVTSRYGGTKVFYSLTDEHARRLVVDAIEQAEHTIGRNHHHLSATPHEKP